MNDASWALTRDDFEASCRHFSMAAALYNKGGMADESNEAYYAKMAFMHAMLAGHTSAEAGLRRLLDLYGETVASSDDWHAELLRSAAKATPHRPAILDAATLSLLNHTRRFRHVAVRSYEDFDASLAAPAVDAAQKLAQTLIGVFTAFKDAVERPRI
jgi:hypothetical protein